MKPLYLACACNGSGGFRHGSIFVAVLTNYPALQARFNVGVPPEAEPGQPLIRRPIPASLASCSCNSFRTKHSLRLARATIA